ncbi:ion channel [Deinococcus roseus]|uniref:Inward rectifier potassium channel Irk n=1 Tax=Deinococcus roseus TaxID=392414 RepID=A0ABQ2CUA7_9DEIO|nr:ion channel [Deinococcus roseus]GGJ21299.1 inward rectifier potassium channel Irk [Deinococcus roseus]
MTESEQTLHPTMPAEDLGIGSVQAQRTERFLTRDGRFNTKRIGLGFLSSLSPFHLLLSLSWGKFFALVGSLFVGLNVLFAFFYMVCGTDALQMTTEHPIENTFWRAFFFSIETFSTIGYGHIAPTTLAAHLVSSIEAFTGLLGAALITGVLFARFSRPTTRILWSNNAIFAPYRGGQGLMVRMTNGAHNELIELDVQVVLVQFEGVNGQRTRRFYPLKLERNQVEFFSLAWTIVHPIDEESPLWGHSEAELQARDIELLVVVHGTDDMLAQHIHARASYKTEDFRWNVKFASIYVPNDHGAVAIDVRKLSELEEVR